MQADQLCLCGFHALTAIGRQIREWRAGAIGHLYE